MNNYSNSNFGFTALPDLSFNWKSMPYNFENNNNSSNLNNINNSNLGWNTQTLAGIAGGLQALSGLANAYLGYKNYNLSKDMFNYQQGLANRNLANQGKIINNTYDNAAQVAAGMIGGRDNSGNYGMTSADIVNKYSNKAKEQHVDGSAI